MIFKLFGYFFILGCTSFGGPAAHIGYFQKLFVEQLNWLTAAEYQQLVALSQVLPGPGSSQVGFAIGLHKYGLIGGVLAFVGFTLPSFILLLLLSYFQFLFVDWGIEGIYAGLKLFAVMVVIDAIWTMGKSFCSSKETLAVCLIASAILFYFPYAWLTPLLILLVGLVGYTVGAIKQDKAALKHESSSHSDTGRNINKVRFIPLVGFFILLIGLPLIKSLHPIIELFDSFYQAGAMVFGGGHVVLPLLQQSMGDVVSQDTFLTGYAAAQIIPGPMFTLATYLGAEWYVSSPVIGAIFATMAVFLPGLLLMYAMVKNWQMLMAKPKLMQAVKYINAAVVGILIVALYNPIGINAVHSISQFLIVILSLFIFRYSSLPIYIFALLSIVGGAILL
ncbi:chromate efflux transporter [Algibacillus agarilyticus]|uniref:chromate efflux transporter n=1 Tax=Algibacillus agarilyticus TaxID=2234133 RepID=UPI0018E572D2|nr:chromate efflux transporter [Algibacillus agarilyticus]